MKDLKHLSKRRLRELAGLEPGSGPLSDRQMQMAQESAFAALDEREHRRSSGEMAADGEEFEPPAHRDESATRYNISDRPFVSLARVRPNQVNWLWPGRIPLGKLTILDGDPGLGKSTLLLDLAARITRGRPMPDEAGSSDGRRSRAPVVLLSAEDGLADTIRPRLEAAGAELHLVLAVNRMPASVYQGPLRIPEHLDYLEELVEKAQARLVILDPLVAYLGQVSAQSDQGVRQALHPLAYRADRLGVAIVAVRHLTKRAGRNPLYRGGGSIGLLGAARAGLVAARDPADPSGTRCILASTKSNLGPPPPALAYRVVTAANGAAAIRWEGPAAYGAADLVSGASPARDGGALEEAKAILREILAEGPVAADEVRRQATRAGLNSHLLWKSKQELGIRSRKVGGRGAAGQGWLWLLPDQVIEDGGGDLKI